MTKPPPSSTKRPNFLFIITDQQRADYLGCMGHPQLKTPHIDSIAETGTRFNRFYVANPVCMPNRASLMTGRMPRSHGVRSNGIPLSVRSNTFVDVLSAGGYRTALIGKSHLQNFTGIAPAQKPPTADLPAPTGVLAQALRPDAPQEDYAHEAPQSWERDDFELPLPFYGFEYVRLCTAHGDRVGGDYLRWVRAQGVDPSTLVGPKNGLAHDYECPQAWRTAIPEALYPTNYIAGQTVRYLEEHQQTTPDDPFFLMMSLPDPHHPFTPPGRYWDMYDPDEVELPASFHTLSDNPPPTLAWAMNERVEGKVTRDAGQFLFVVNEREAREAIALTCGMLALIDDAVGNVLNTLQRLNLDENTVVVFTSDHGDFLGDHRLLLKGPIHRQSLVRVPCLWRDPMAPTASTQSDRLSSTVDLAPSILERAGLAPYQGMQGQSFAGELGPTHEGPDCVIIEDDQQRTVLGFDSSPRVHTLITRHWRMSIYDNTDWGELYNLSNDPNELCNLWDDQAHRAQKGELMEMFLRRQIALVDRSPLPSALA